MSLIKIKLGSSEAVIPFQSTEGSVGFDIVAIDSGVELPHGYIRYDTGVYLEMPDDIYALIYPRSSVYQRGMFLANSVGVIDSDYRGELKIMLFQAIPELDIQKYEKGDKIAQLVFYKKLPTTFLQIDELSTTIRNDGGFGSTDKVQ